MLFLLKIMSLHEYISKNETILYIGLYFSSYNRFLKFSPQGIDPSNPVVPVYTY
jgi:hypothetical protein